MECVDDIAAKLWRANNSVLIEDDVIDDVQVCAELVVLI